ncbi:splicing factor 3B subunit 1-like [Dorcoceras hygrometricum]|uniref:Splicing factor 3B subunit 1-like n=1 Tax=Dorcoceras hygrometricum TaxID=472368 RepID=A0A2Z7B2M1_9LAMI|nr:splicing factor 3B subunit 1-like [Dorcoceras hygrometricum]
MVPQHFKGNERSEIISAESAKYSVTVKAGSFDAVTQERFLMMTAIHFGVKVNLSKPLFETLKEMADKSTKRAKGFAAQICVLLKGDPSVILGEVKTFPPLKILLAKTVNTYVATNKTIDARGESDESEVAKVTIVKKKSVSKKKYASTAGKDTYEAQVEIVAEKAVSKKRPATASDAPVVKKKKTTTGKAATAEKDLTLVKRKEPKRKLRLPTGSDDEIVEKEPALETVLVKQKGTTSIDDINNIIEQVIAETAQMETAVGIPDVTDFEASATRSDDIAIDETDRSIAINDEDDNLDGAENEIARKMTSVTAPKQFLKEPLRSREDDDISGFKNSSQVIATEGKQIEEVATTDEGSISIEDLLQQIPDDAMLPSVIAAEPTRIKFGLGIQIPGVNEVDQYKASLPQIAATDKGKEPLVVDTIQGHPAREILSLICADIDFLVQLREKVIEGVANFFNSFSLRRLAALGSVKAIAAKEERVLTWGETDSVHIALQRRVYIIYKYRELLRKFLEARRHNFVFGTPTTTTDLKVLELLTAAHRFALKVFLRQMKEHKLEWTRPSNSHLFEGATIDRGFFIPRNHRTYFSTCWIRAMILVDGSWLIDEGIDYWRPITRPVDSRKWELLPQRPYNDDLAPLCAFIEPVQDIDSRSPFSRIVHDHWAEVLPEVESISSDGSTVYRSPSPRSALSISSQDTDPVVQTGLISTEPSVHIAPAVYIELDPTDTVSLSQQNPDIALPSPSQSSSTDSSMHFNTDDIPLGADTAVEQILMPTTASPAIDLTEQFAQLRASISQLSIKQMRTQISIGNLQNHLLSKIDDLEKASVDALIEFKKCVRAQNGIFTTELADIHKEIKDQKAELSKEFNDRLAAIRNDVLEFPVETQEQLTTLRDTLAKIMAYITRGRDDKNGEVGSSQGRGQPPPEDRSKPGSGYGGSGGSRSEPSRKRGSSGARQRDWRYWLS